MEPQGPLAHALDLAPLGQGPGPRQAQQNKSTQISGEVETADALGQARLQRRRLWQMRARLKKRWHRAWAAERKAYQRRCDELAHAQSLLQKESQRLEQRRIALDRERLRFNGEKELSQRKLEAVRNEVLHQEQRLMEERRSLEEHVRALDQKERTLTETKRRETDSVQRLSMEANGLEQRVRNLRSQLINDEQELAKSKTRWSQSLSVPALVEIAAPPAWEADLQEYLHLLDQLACCLTDERLRLFGQAEQLALARSNWEKEHASQLQKSEARFQTLTKSEQSLENRLLVLRQQQSEVFHVRQSLESWQSRLTLQAANWKGERERLFTQIQSLEARAGRLKGILADLPPDWKDRYRQEDTNIIQMHRDASAEADYAQLRQELECLRGQCTAYEQQVADLNAEVERLANLLMQANDADFRPVAKAA
jgi:DNA repair exonuclease SbcCD ATPase subunit